MSCGSILFFVFCFKNEIHWNYNKRKSHLKQEWIWTTRYAYAKGQIFQKTSKFPLTAVICSCYTRVSKHYNVCAFQNGPKFS